MTGRTRAARAMRAGTAAAVLATSLVTAVVLPSSPADAATTFYRPADGVLHIAGHGYGHGHGMSQWGAYGGAMAGKSWREIVGWYYNSPALATSNVSTIAVRIGANGSGPLTVLPGAGLTALDNAGNKLVLPTTIDGKSVDQWRAALVTGPAFRVQGHTSAGWTNVAPTGGTVTSWTGWIRFVDGSQPRIITMVRPSGTHVLYRDSLELEQSSGTAGVTINLVTLDHYLYGVVPSEMPCSWTPTVGGSKKLEGLAAQAVAARSYAAWRAANPHSSLVTIYDDTRDQAYGGYSAEQTAASNCPWTTSTGAKTSASNAAVDATAGQVMVDSSGRALFAQYSASNGGYEISGSQSYLPSRPDAWDGRPTESWNSHDWTDTVSAGQIEAAYPSIGTFRTLTINSRENLSGKDQTGATVGEEWGGRVTSLTLAGSRGSATTTGTGFRSALGLMSEWFTVVVARPGVPRSVTATATDGQATVRWTEPASDGGGGITSYTITASPSIPAVTVAGTARSALITGLTNDTTYTFTVVAHNSAGNSPGASAGPVTPSAHLLFHALTHAVVLDTGAAGVGAGVTRAVQVTGVAGIPASGVLAVALNVASVTSNAASSAMVWPHGGSRPPTAQLAWNRGQPVNTTVHVDVGTGGQVDVRNAAGTARLLVIAEGYYTSASDASASAPADSLTAVAAYRLFGGRAGTAIPAKGTATFAVVGRDGVPSGATAAMLQLTVANPPGNTYLQVWPSGTRSRVYDLYGGGHTKTVTTVVPLDATGKVTVSPYSASNVIVDLIGWYTSVTDEPANGTVSLLRTARRLATTSVPAAGTVTLAVPASAGVPSVARSVLLQISGTGPVAGSVLAWPAGTTKPGTGSLALQGATPAATTVLVPLGSGKVSLYNGARTAAQLTVDVVGWSSG